MINAFTLCDLFEHFRKIMHQTEKGALSVGKLKSSDMNHLKMFVQHLLRINIDVLLSLQPCETTLELLTVTKLRP